MGRNSQQRRQHKLRHEQQRQRDAFSRSPAGDSTLPPVADLLDLACAAAHGPMADKRQFAMVMTILHQIEAEEAEPIDRPSALLQRSIHTSLDLVFEGGWHPADVAHAAKRAFTQRVARLSAQFAAAHAREHDAVHRAPPLWLDQLAELGVLADGAVVGGQGDLVARWAKAERLHPDDALDGAVQLLALLRRTRRQPPLLPPPSKWAATNAGNAYASASAAARGEVDAKALRTIRALLAKAEGTTFEAEAEAFTAKAQELMARHSIDAAVVAAAAMGEAGRVARGTEARRVHIDDPYADEKVSLLANIGHVNGARCVWSSESGFATVVGFPVDLQLTEVLYTSLLVQATRAAAHATAHDVELRTASFRRAFLMAFAERVAERLEATARHVTEEAEQEYGSSLLPALAQREAQVDATYEEMFPGATPMRQRSLNAAGYWAGRAAGDRADIGAGKPLPRGRASRGSGAAPHTCHDDGVSDNDHLPHDFPKDASEHTRAANSRPVPPFDPADFDRANRGLIAQHPTGTIDGPLWPAWDWSKWDFIQQDSPAPDTVNPSLWRQARLNAIHGLFEVAPGCWQARGYDISNITFIEGKDGWVVIDPLTNTQTAAACLELANAHLGARPVTAVIYTHSHLDHFGGVLGVTSQDDVDAGRCQIIAPEHFMRETVAENLLAGMAMNRRALYQFGPLLPPGPRGHVDSGLGKCVPLGTPGLIPPTVDITATGQELLVDGVRIVFQLTPETEAPAEMNFYFPDHKWLCMAENCSHNMHNLIPIRGAQVRDSLSWSTYIDDALDMFGGQADLMFASHHWPRWGGDDVRGFLARQRDLYRWVHDQTLRLANHGYVASEIAEMLHHPPEHFEESHTVGYYGSLVHNIKAVYQRYLSWYDGNPCHLHPHPPVEAGKRYVELAGGPDALLAKARVAFDAGDYRWVSELVNHLVFADPLNTEARRLQADALEQLGYQHESATMRNAYLMGAHELRHGGPPRNPAGNRGLVRALPIDQLLSTVAMRLKADEVAGVDLSLNLVFTDIHERWLVGLSHRALRYRQDRQDPGAGTITTTREVLSAVVAGDRSLDDAIGAGELHADSDAAADALRTIVDHLDGFLGGFPIVEP